MKKKYIRVNFLINQSEIEDYLNNGQYSTDYKIIYYSEISKDASKSQVTILFERIKTLF